MPRDGHGSCDARGDPFDEAVPDRHRFFASPLNRLYRRTDLLAALAALALVWVLHLNTRSDLLHAGVTLADALLLLAFVVTWPFLCELAALYERGIAPGSWREARHVVIATVLGSVAGALLLPVNDTLHPRHIAFFWLLSTVLMLAVRAALRVGARHWQQKHPAKVAIAGTGPRARELLREIRTRPDLSMEVVGFFDESAAFEAASELEWLGGVATAEQTLMRLDVDEVFITLPVKSRYADVQRLIDACDRTGTPARYFGDVFQFATRRWLFHRDGTVELITFPRDARVIIKRLMDIVIAATGVVVAALPMLMIALIVRLDSPGPIFYKQARIGRNRHRFFIWKFRTMTRDAEQRQAALEEFNEAGGPIFKISHDPRITRAGKWLRRSSLDELPQLINVLRGEMSLVGPRPLPLRDVGRFGEPWMMRRFSAPPGLTGLWQVHGRSMMGFDDLIAMDLQYIDHWSLGLDLRILAATIPAVVRGHGAM